MKKTYITPEIKVNSLNLQEFIAFSGGGVESDDPKVDDIPDDGNDPNRAPRYRYSVWDD